MIIRNGKSLKKILAKSFKQPKLDLVDDMIQFADYLSRKGIADSKQKIAYVRRRWKELFCRQLKKWKWNTKAQESLFEFGEYGHNWEKLHPTEEEEKRTVAEWLVNLSGELHYCSDRMGLDRLLRCHWRFNQAMGIIKYAQTQKELDELEAKGK